MAEIQPIVMPKWGLAMQEGMLAAWHVDVGANLTKGQEIMDIETSKIANVYETLATGPLRRRLVGEGETVPVGALLGVVADASIADADIDAFVDKFQADFAEIMASRAAESGGPEPETVDAAGKRIRYLKLGEGDGDPVVFIHGYGGDLNNWLFNQPALAEGRVAYAIDLPGHGGSTKDVGAGDVASLAGAVVDWMDALDIGKAHLVGHSLGGAIALFLAVEKPDRVASATLVCPAGLGSEISMEYIDGFNQTSRARKLKPILEMLVADPSLVTNDMVEDVLKFKRLDGVDAALTKLSGTLFANGKQAASFKDKLAGLTVPIQIIWGAEDRIVPAKHGEGLPATIKVTTFPGAGHLAHMEKSAETNELIKAIVAA